MMTGWVNSDDGPRAGRDLRRGAQGPRVHLRGEVQDQDPQEGVGEVQREGLRGPAGPSSPARGRGRRLAPGGLRPGGLGVGRDGRRRSDVQWPATWQRSRTASRSRSVRSTGIEDRPVGLVDEVRFVGARGRALARATSRRSGSWSRCSPRAVAPGRVGDGARSGAAFRCVGTTGRQQPTAQKRAADTGGTECPRPGPNTGGRRVGRTCVGPCCWWWAGFSHWSSASPPGHPGPRADQGGVRRLRSRSRWPAPAASC